MKTITRLRLLWKLASMRALLWIAGAGRTGEPRPEVHAYLADLHYQLAAEYEAARRWRVARRHRHLAETHATSSSPRAPEPPHAAAMAMPVPQPPIFVDARTEPRWPDDVA